MSPPRQALSVFLTFPRPPDSPRPWAPVSGGCRASPCLSASLHSAFPIQSPTVSHILGIKTPVLTAGVPPSSPHTIPCPCPRLEVSPAAPSSAPVGPCVWNALPSPLYPGAPTLPGHVLSGDACAPPGHRPLPRLLPTHCRSRICVAQYTSRAVG